MKRMILALAIVLCPGAALGGTLLPGYIETGGYGTVSTEFTQLGDGETGFFLGGGGGLILNRRFLIGADLALLANDIEYQTVDGDDRFIELTKANLNFTWIFWPDALVHPAATLSGGMGWLRLRNPDKGVDETDPDADTIFQVEPTAHLILNVTSSTRLSLSGGYRWVSGVNTGGFIDGDAEGGFVTISFVFGAF
jgi:hypothetical protein